MFGVEILQKHLNILPLVLPGLLARGRVVAYNIFIKKKTKNVINLFLVADGCFVCLQVGQEHG